MGRIERLAAKVYDAIETMDKAERTLKEATADLRRLNGGAEK